MAVESQAPQANGLKTVADTIVAPKEAFASLRVVPTWGLALSIAIVLTAIGTYLLIPAIQHATLVGWPAQVAANPRMAQMTPEAQQSALNLTIKMAGFSWLFVIVGVPFFCLIESIVMLIFDKIGRGDGTFGKYFAASCNIAVTAAIGTVVVGIIAMVRGPESFATQQAVQAGMPSLGSLVPATGKLGAFLSAITPFSVWSTALVILALTIVGRVRTLQAWLGGIVLLLIPALLAATFAK